MTQSELNGIKFIYFDLDDTLLDHKSAQMKALQKVIDEVESLGEITSEQLKQVYHQRNQELWHLYNHGKITKEELKKRRFTETLEELGLSQQHYEKVAGVYMHYYRQSWGWIDGAESAFYSISRNVPTGIVTNGFTETQYPKLQQFGLMQNGRKVIISEEVGYLKPDPRIYKYAVEQVGAEPSEVLYVGDSYNSDIEGGNAAGLKTAWFARGQDTAGKNTADIIFDDFTELEKKLEVSSSEK